MTRLYKVYNKTSTKLSFHLFTQLLSTDINLKANTCMFSTNALLSAKGLDN